MNKTKREREITFIFESSNTEKLAITLLMEFIHKVRVKETLSEGESYDENKDNQGGSLR